MPDIGRIRSVLATLNAVFAIAIVSSEAEDESSSEPIGSRNAYFATQKQVMQKAVPIMLKTRCITAALFASRFAPIEEITAVMHVPMPSPITMGTEAPIETCPVVERACKIPTDAELD